jgi:hypothetical protein
MAILQLDGFDHYGNGSVGTATIRAAFESAGYATVSATRGFLLGTAYGKNAGSYGARLTSSVSTDTAANQVQISKPIQPEQYKGQTPYVPKDFVILGFAFRMVLNPTAELVLARIGDHDISIGIDMVLCADTLPTSFQAEMSIWNYCELEVNMRDSKYRVWVNDVMVSEKTLTEQTVKVDRWEIKAYYRANGTGGQAIVDVDDKYLMDGSTSASSVATVRLGKVSVATRLPTADAEVAFARDSGTSNFSRVGQQANDGDTSYVYSGTPGTQDLYSNAAALTVVDDNAVIAVAVHIAARQTEPDSMSVAAVIKSGGQTYEGGRMALKAASYASEKAVFELDPGTGLRWKPTAVVAATFGQKILDKPST